MGWGPGGGGIKQKGKRTHGHGQQCDDCQGKGGIRGLNGNGKIQWKFFKNQEYKLTLSNVLSKSVDNHVDSLLYIYNMLHWLLKQL